MPSWTKDTALAELDRLTEQIGGLITGHVHSATHMQWKLVTIRFLEEVFDLASLYYQRFINIDWVYHGPMAVHVREVFVPGATEDRYNQPVYFKALEISLGILGAAREELTRRELEEVYEGKDTGPEASLIFRLINTRSCSLRR